MTKRTLERSDATTNLFSESTKKKAKTYEDDDMPSPERSSDSDIVMEDECGENFEITCPICQGVFTHDWHDFFK